MVRTDMKVGVIFESMGDKYYIYHIKLAKKLSNGLHELKIDIVDITNKGWKDGWYYNDDPEDIEYRNSFSWEGDKVIIDTNTLLKKETEK